MWSMGRCEISIAGQVHRHIYLALRLTPNVTARFVNKGTVLLFVAEHFHRIEDDIAHHIFLLEDALCVDHGNFALNIPYLADSLHGDKQNNKLTGHALTLLRISRLTKIVHVFLIKAGKVY